VDEPAGLGFLEIGLASSALPGEAESGDSNIFCPLPQGALLAVIDGLGHGPSAAHAARVATEVFQQYSGDTLIHLVERCHMALKTTRGVAMTAALIDSNKATLTWVGVGNVEGKLMRANPNSEDRNESVLLRGGIVGYRLPLIRPATTAIKAHDLLILATDGVAPNFSDGVILGDPAQRIAQRIMEQYRKHDDAMVLTARYLG